VIFTESPEPHDVQAGILSAPYVASALAVIAERPALVERLFLTKTVSSSGLIRVKMVKNGEWVTVTLDDYLPCVPMGGLQCINTCSGDFWAPILEKAYAKLHNHYGAL
jgi:calpain-15